MNWKEYITRLGLADKDSSFDFNLPASDSLLDNLYTQCTLKELPAELEELYRQTNGVTELSNTVKTGELIWTIERVIETNREYRNDASFKELYMTFDQLLFISDAGNGDLFGFVTLNGKFDRHDIFVWDHETDSRSWVAPNLETFIKWWTNGTITV